MSKVRLTKTVIAALKHPEKGQIFVSDTATRGLCVRLRNGGKVFYYYRRVGKRVVQKKIGKVGDIQLEAARRRVEELNAKMTLEGEAAFQKPEEPEPEPEEATITLQDAMDETLKRSKRGDRARADWYRVQKRFLPWMAETYPNVLIWADLKRSMVREYLSIFDGMGANYRRLQLQPIVQTSKFFAIEYPDLFRDVAQNLKIGNKLKTKPPSVMLPDLLEFIKACDPIQPLVLPVVALCGLASLRPSEAVRLTWDNVDLERGLLTVSGQTKNAHSHRMIPICGHLIEILKDVRREQASATIKATGPDYVAKTQQGGNFEGTNYENLTRLFRLVRGAFNTNCKWMLKDLRNALPSWAGSVGRSGNVLEQYLGHVPVGVTAKHYTAQMTKPVMLAKAMAGERAEAEKNMGTIRNILIDPWQAAIESTQAEANHNEIAKPSEAE